MARRITLGRLSGGTARLLPAVIMLAAALTGLASAAPAQAATKYVYLTFDDGPSPTYTRQVLDILTRYQVRATFFEVGQNVASYPSITHLAYTRGNSVQNHTWAHRDLRHVSWNTFKYQVKAADRVISGQTGYTPHCLRPPYGYVNASVYARAGSLGKQIRLWTVDPRDWSRPGTSVIVSRVLNNVRSGSVVLLHDGGGNRSQTVAALPTILKTLKARGYAFYRMWC
jgi:peptidoglycan-N-acetylglucosamine deacetylase